MKLAEKARNVRRAANCSRSPDELPTGTDKGRVAGGFWWAG